jgi:non-specific serine/threonine protein kinase
LAPALAYWRGLAARYLIELCHTPQTARAPLEPIPPPPPAELATLLLGVPPMPGGEYVTEEAIAGLWSDLDAWVRGQAAAKSGLSEFLKERAPQWHQVGRVCFHLAENRRDPDYPFAFLATYAPSISGSGRVQYQPLSQALRQYAGAKDKQTLVKLLSPVHLASQKSALAKELVDSGDIYQAMAWTPPQAYRFLKDAPVLEESGVLVRLPDWWKKRPRPRVGVNIGEKKQSKFDADAMLDFQVQLVLGDQRLSQSEWRELMAAEDGLVLLRGQWVEVDREKLREALDHWKKLEEQAEDGGIRSSKACACLPARPRIWRTTARGTPSGSGLSFMPAIGWARCSPTCAARRTLRTSN